MKIHRYTWLYPLSIHYSRTMCGLIKDNDCVADLWKKVTCKSCLKKKPKERK